jgi:integrase/recombinase XerD
MTKNLEALAEKYRRYLTVSGYASGTVKNDLFYLRRFFTFLESLGVNDVADVARETVRDYQRHLYEEINARGEPNSVSSQNNALKAVKGFFRFLRREDYLVSDPACEITYARAPKRLPRSVLTRAEIRKIISAPDTRTVLGYRDRVILEVLYSTGIRKAEVNGLLLQDVDCQEGFLRVNDGKGKKDRVVPLGKIACRYIENYVKAVRPSLIRDPYEQHLFLSMKGKRLSKNMVWEIVKRYRKKARIQKKVSPHTFRHTCATLMLRNKANIRHIQEMLGHASLNSTQVYAAVSITDLKEVHKRCHPREKDRE